MTIYIPVLGKRLRLTRLDVCGNVPEAAALDAVVTTKGFISVGLTAEVDLNSINTRDEQRDGHLRSADFFEVESHPTMTFASTGVKANGDDYVVLGDLTIKGATRPVELDLEFNGTHPDPWGGTRAGFSAETEISRKEFGVDFEVPMDGPGVVVGDKIKVILEVEAVLDAG